MPFQEVANRANAQILRSGSVLISYLKGPVTMTELNADFAHQVAIVSEHGKVSSLVVLDAKSMGRPDEAVKRKAAENTLSLGEKFAGTALVVVGDGLLVTILRTAILAYMLISRAGSKQKIFSNVDEALAWLKTLPGQLPDVRNIDARDIKQAFKLEQQKAA